ncbi:quinone oxidoreductase-like protein 2 [Plakobranchus ocellatus]|uniref:Quinone oxidoreductase-like protein 2 n=1 Tax=Plakobranchus ocellatus TaxID=259542 RepID=A0AAV4DKG0_9GAST|nr:quinone oxidoreductase-like protein 2 [Plakobranchus ocellatus]
MAFQSPPEVLFRQCLRSGRSLSQTAMAPSACSSRQIRGYRAAVINQLGQPMVIQTMPPPKPLKPSEVLISTHAAGINFADILQWKGQYQEKLEPPFVPGFEISGKVIEVGSEVKTHKVGDRVVAISPAGGAFAEMCVVSSEAVFPVPDNLRLVEAAGTITSYGTAMLGLTHNAKLRAGEKVLVTAAAGATGLAAVDIAKNLFNCEVIGVCGSIDKCQFLKRHGVDYTINYSTDRLRDSVKEITNGRGVNVAVDQVGGDTLLQCVKSLGFEGRALTVGYASGKIPDIPANLMLLKSASLVGVYWGSYSKANPPAFVGSIMKVLQAVAEGKIKPHVGKTFPLDQINEAFQYVSDRKSVGKTVIQLQEEYAPLGP